MEGVSVLTGCSVSTACNGSVCFAVFCVSLVCVPVVLNSSVDMDACNSDS